MIPAVSVVLLLREVPGEPEGALHLGSEELHLQDVEIFYLRKEKWRNEIFQ